MYTTLYFIFYFSKYAHLKNNLFLKQKKILIGRAYFRKQNNLEKRSSFLKEHKVDTTKVDSTFEQTIRKRKRNPVLK
jgi:hypothetical protein